jgi:hypothetical protein
MDAGKARLAHVQVLRNVNAITARLEPKKKYSRKKIRSPFVFAGTINPGSKRLMLARDIAAWLVKGEAVSRPNDQSYWASCGDPLKLTAATNRCSFTTLPVFFSNCRICIGSVKIPTSLSCDVLGEIGHFLDRGWIA